MTLYSRSNARKSLIDTVAYRALSQVATVASFIVLVRSLDEHDFGVFNLLYAILPVIIAVGSFGLEQVLRRYTPEYLRAGNQPAAMWLIRFLGSARFGSNLVILAAILLAWNLVAPPFKLAPYRVQFMLFCVVALLHFQMQFLQLALGAHMLHRYSVGATALLSFCKLAGYLLFAGLGTLTLEAAIIVDAVGYALAWGGLRFAYRRHCIVEAPPYKPAPEERRRLIRYGLFNNFNDAGSLLLLNPRTDNFFIAAIIDPVSVAVYSFYTRLQGMIDGQLPVRMFENVINPMLFSQRREEASRDIPRYFSLMLNMNLLVQWPVMTATLVFHEQIVQVVFGGRYVEYSWLMPLIAAFWMLNTFAIPVTMIAQYYEKAHVILWSKVTVVVNVVLLLTLVPTIGVYGAALASGISTAAKNFIVWWFVRDQAVWLGGFSAVASAVAIWGTAVLICEGLRHFLPLGPWLQLASGAMVLGLAGLLHVRSPALSLSDRELLRSVLKPREQKWLRKLGVLKAEP